VNNDSGSGRFAFHIPPESDFRISRNPYSPFPGTLIHMPRNPQIFQQLLKKLAAWFFYGRQNRRALLNGLVLYFIE